MNKSLKYLVLKLTSKKSGRRVSEGTSYLGTNKQNKRKNTTKKK